MTTTTQQNEISELMAELDSVTAQLTKTRELLWSTQDKLKEKDDKLEALNSRVSQLSKDVVDKDKVIEKLQEENSNAFEEEAKVRESLELMKKVFARTQLKSKEDREAILLLQEERDLLLKENKMLRSEGSKHDKTAYNRLKKESSEKEKTLTSILEKTKKELAEMTSKCRVANDNVKVMSKRLHDYSDGNETYRQLEKQRRKIDYLERQLLELQDQDGDALVSRGIFDEDLDQSLAREMMRTLDCSQPAFDEGLTKAYQFMGVQQSPSAAH